MCRWCDSLPGDGKDAEQSPQELFPLGSAELYIVLFIYQKSFFLFPNACPAFGLSTFWVQEHRACLGRGADADSRDLRAKRAEEELPLSD